MIERQLTNILSTRELDQILLPVDNAERAIRIPLTDIASSEVAVFGECFFRKIWTFEVAFGNRWSSDADLADDVSLLSIVMGKDSLTSPVGGSFFDE